MRTYRVDMESTELPVEYEEWVERLERFIEVLENDPLTMGAVAAGAIGRLGTVFVVEADSFSEATTIADASFDLAIEVAAGDLEPEVHSERLLIEFEDYQPLELIGAGEAAEILGVKRQRLYQLRELYLDFPAPVATPKRGALWDRRAIVAWGQKERPVGRPQVVHVAPIIATTTIMTPQLLVSGPAESEPQELMSTSSSEDRYLPASGGGRRKVAARKRSGARRPSA